MDVRKKEHFYTAGGNVNQRSLKKLTIELSYNSAIPLLDIYLKECAPGYDRATYICMFITALFIIAKPWKQPRCPMTNEWIKKMCYTYTMEFYSAIKRIKLCYLQVNQQNWTDSY
jgi:hypothetical protein